MGLELLCAIGGLFFGIIIGIGLIKGMSAKGKLTINDTDPNADYLTTTFYDIDDIWHKKYVLFEIVKTSKNTSK